MYKAGEIELVIAKALGRWAEENSYSSALPPVWLRELSDRIGTYFTRLCEQDKFDKDAFEEDVYKLVSSLAASFLPSRRSNR